MRAKKIAAILLAGVMSLSVLTGCSNIDKSAVIATTNEIDVTLGVANFFCHYDQALYEDFYKSILGTEDVWNADPYGTGSTMAEMVLESAMSELHEMYTLKQNMDKYQVSLSEDEKKAIKDATTKFMNDNSKKALKAMGATSGIVEEVLELYTIRAKMQDAIYAETDVNVSDAEANMRGYSQVVIRTDSHTDEEGNSVAYTDEEKEELKAKANKVLSELSAEGATLKSVAEANGLEVTSQTYATFEETSEEGEEDTEDEVVAALKKLKVGENSGLIEKSNGYYFVCPENDTDKEATEKNRESIIQSRKTSHYSEVLSGWQEDDEWDVNSKVLAKITFEQPFTTTDPNKQTEETDSTESNN